MQKDKSKFLEFAKKNLRVLYIEDHEDARMLTTILLEEFFKEVVSVSDPQKALEYIKKEHFDIIITDITMPKINGIDLLKKIKDKDIYKVLLTAHSDFNYLLELIDIGIDGYLLKPVSTEQLENLVIKLAQKAYYKYEAKRYQRYLEVYKDATRKAFLVTVTDPKGIIKDANELFCKKSKYTKEEIIGKPHSIIRHPKNPKIFFKKMWKTIKEDKEPFRGIIRNRAKDGSSYYVDSIIYPILDENGNIEEYISIRNDVSDILQQKFQLEAEIESANRPVLVMIKLKDYDLIESFYEKTLLKSIIHESHRFLQEVISKKFQFDRLYFLEEGTFAFVIDQNCDKKSLVKQLLIIQNKINQSYIKVKDILFNIDIMMSASFERDKLFESAKNGLKRLEMKKRSFFVTSSLMKRLNKKAKENIKILNLIKEAITKNQIIPFLQPIVDNRTKKVVKYEVLIRLMQDKTPVTPSIFLHSAKQSHYYFDMSKTIIKESFELADKNSIPISINLSILDLQKPSMRSYIKRILESFEKIANLITFEILEDYPIESIGIIRHFLQNIKEMGATIAIDDFGSGYSNYQRLLYFHPDIIKIDGSLIKDILTNSFSQSMVKSIVTFAKEQNLKTVAEFVENEEIYNMLKTLGVDYSQGYYFGKPAPVEEYIPTNKEE